MTAVAPGRAADDTAKSRMKPDVLKDLNDLCTRLFDAFCERRSVIPLAYLMHSWPLLDLNPSSRRRLRDDLVDLQRWHFGELLEGEQVLIERALTLLSPRMVRLPFAAPSRKPREPGC
jgi:hypothetical protein